MQPVFDRLKNLLNKSRESKYLITENTKLNIHKDLFKKLTPKDSNNNLVFVDGGNGEIAGSSDFSLHFVRIAVVSYKNNKRINTLIKECFILASSFIENSLLFFKVDCIDAENGVIFDSFKINARDKFLTTGTKPIEPLVAVLHVRKLLELKQMLSVAKNLDFEDIVVRDGDFEEGPFVNEILFELKKTNPVSLGVSKTSTILTDSGDAAVEVLLHFGGKSSWVYNNFSPCFVKLNTSSNYVFKVEFIKDFNLESLNTIASMSSDPVFLGYPYGLIAVDALARVNSSWVDIYKALFESIIGTSQISKDAHNILNKVA